MAVELTADNRRALYVPPYFAHGYQTLVDDTEVIYQVGGSYTPGAERGLRYDDPALGIDWPLPVSVISDKDASWPLLADATALELAASRRRSRVIIVDTALERRAAEGGPIRVAMVGAGFMGRGVANQILNSRARDGAGRHRQPHARQAPSGAYREAGVAGARARSTTRRALDAAIADGVPAITDDYRAVLSRPVSVDAIVEATGAVEFGAHVVLRRHRRTASTWS